MRNTVRNITDEYHTAIPVAGVRTLLLNGAGCDSIILTVKFTSAGSGLTVAGTNIDKVNELIPPANTKRYNNDITAATDWYDLRAIDLNTGDYVDTITADGNYKIEDTPKYLKISGSSTIESIVANFKNKF